MRFKKYINEVNKWISNVKQISLKMFVKNNRTKIDKYVNKVYKRALYDDKERAEFVKKNTDLSLWARQEGVKFK